MDPSSRAFLVDRVIRTSKLITLVCFAITFSAHSALADAPKKDAPPEAKASDDAKIRVAIGFARKLADGQYTQAIEQFNDTMKRALPEKRLQEAWGMLLEEHGAFKAFGEPSTEQVTGHIVVILPAEFERGSCRLKIAINKDDQVAGFYLDPADPGRPAYDREKTYVEKKVAFGDEPWRIQGKLTLPRGKKGVPVVVLVHGSGPHDEDETIGPNKPFRDIAGGLSSQGIAVLRYQKRTFAHRLRLAAKGTITVHEEVIEDALTALQFARSQPEIDSNKVFVLGHSLGATLALHIAQEDGKLTGAILLAGTPRDFCEVLEEQLQYIASLPGPSQERNKKLYETTKKTIEDMRAGKAAPDASILNVPLPYWRELTIYAQDSLSLLPTANCRVFIAGGGRDYQVTRKDFDLYRAAAAKAKNRVDFKWYENLNHLFAAGEGKATPAEFAKPQHVDVEVVRDLANWIRSK